MNGRMNPQAASHAINDHPVNPADLPASLSRVPSGQYDSASVGFNNSIPHGGDEAIQVRSAFCCMWAWLTSARLTAV